MWANCNSLFESPAAYQVRVPQKVLEAFGVERIHCVLSDREERQVTLIIQGHNTKPRTCNMSWSEKNILQNVTDFNCLSMLSNSVIFFNFFFYALKVEIKSFWS